MDDKQGVLGVLFVVFTAVAAVFAFFVPWDRLAEITFSDAGPIEIATFAPASSGHQRTVAFRNTTDRVVGRGRVNCAVTTADGRRYTRTSDEIAHLGVGGLGTSTIKVDNPTDLMACKFSGRTLNMFARGMFQAEPVQVRSE